MNTDILNRSFLRTAVFPFIIVTVSGIILGVTHVQDADYKSDFFADDGFSESIFLFIVCSFLMMVLSLTLFLNSYKAFYKNLVLSLIAWLLFPLLFTLKVLSGHISTLIYYPEEISSFDYYLIGVFMIHLLPLVISFIQYRISINKAKSG